MKKMVVFALAALLVLAFTLPASALESQFGGYWRTRMYTQQNFTGEDQTEGKDLSIVDTRTRLYYTAVFHENLKFVNKFEFNTIWGDTVGGDIGADGMGNFRIKNSYADFNLGPVNFKVGIQGTVVSKGLFFDDDFSGAMVTYKGAGFAIPFVWMKAYEGYNAGYGKDNNDGDVDYFGVLPVFNLGDAMTLQPFFIYAYSKEANAWTNTLPKNALAGIEELNMWYAGLNFDATFDPVSFWATGIYQGGDADLLAGDSMDFKAWLAAAGFNVGLGFGDVHGQAFYATGDDGEDADWERFWVPRGQSYYWSEIMGYGIFDYDVSNNAPADQIGNIMAANLGVTVKPMDKLSISLDVWYAALAEDIVVSGDEENYLGTEVDLKVTYKLVEGLTLDVVGAYLFAGDATTLGAEDDANPYEIGTRLSLSF